LSQSAENFKERAQTKHKLLLVLSDGHDQNGKVKVRPNGRYVSSDLNVERYVDELERDGVTIVGLGIGQSSEPIDMFPRWYKFITDEDIIGEIILKLIESKLDKGSIPQGDLQEIFRNIGAPAALPEALSLELFDTST
jgi:hypothetical protein